MKTKITLFTLLVIVLTACPFIMAANSQIDSSDAGIYCVEDPNDFHGE